MASYSPAKHLFVVVLKKKCPMLLSTEGVFLTLLDSNLSQKFHSEELTVEQFHRKPLPCGPIHLRSIKPLTFLTAALTTKSFAQKSVNFTS